VVKIAFVCVENAGRSQMAAAFARAMAPASVEIISGGTRPAARVHPVVVEAMREVGIDLSLEHPKRVGPADLAAFDIVVTMGCSEEDVCPALFRGDARDWTLPDPKNRTLEEVRQVRADIEQRVRVLLQEIASDAARQRETGTRGPASGGQRRRKPRGSASSRRTRTEPQGPPNSSDQAD
jgi:protein-tyrosine-phosphatase